MEGRVAVKSFIKYPGGKSRMIQEILPRLPKCNTFVDIFTGGGSIAIAYAYKHKDSNIVMNDLDKYTFSMWDVIVNGTNEDIEMLCKYVMQIPTIELFKKNRVLMSSTDRVILAYLGIFFHKCTFSGMFKGSPIGGMEQKSKWKIGCHYNGNNLTKKILEVRDLLNERTTVTNKDFSQVTEGDFAYYDPPYVTVGDNLYALPFNDTLHRKLATHLYNKRNWLLSYNDHPLVRELYSKYKIEEYQHKISMSSFSNGGKCKTKTELLISPT